MKRLVSLFDSTGEWSRPFLEAGWDVIQLDLDHGHDIMRFFEEEVEHYGVLDNGPVDAVMSATPCTDFTTSGAQYWSEKDATGQTDKALELHRMSYEIIEFLKPDWWVLENPIGRLPQLGFGPYRTIWEPWQFAGWTEPTSWEIAKLAELRARQDFENFTEEEIDLTRTTNAYTKATCLWGDFKMPTPKPIEPVRVCSQGSWLMLLGGKGSRTKHLRSATPAGFARAFYEANKDHAPHRCQTCNGEGQLFEAQRWVDCPAQCDEGREWTWIESVYPKLQAEFAFE